MFLTDDIISQNNITVQSKVDKEETINFYVPCQVGRVRLVKIKVD